MKQNLFIPACHKFLIQKDGTPDYQRIYSVSKSAFNLKYPEQEIDNQLLFHFLQTNCLLPASMTIDDLDIQKLDLCFSVISQYKCNSICQLCGYSPLYTNQLEAEETILLGYSICNWNNLQLLLTSGVTCRLFRSRIPVSEKSSIPVVPLNRLAFEYLEKIPKSQDDLLNVPAKIVASIKENNTGKLSTADFKIILRYLENLYNSNFQYTKIEEITSIMKNRYQLSLKSANTTEANSTVKSLEKTSTVPSPEPIVLEGFLSARKPGKSLTRNPQQETTNKKIEDKKITPSGNQAKDVVPQLSHKPANSAPSSIRNIHHWEIKTFDFTNPAVVNLEEADSYQMESFKNSLLRTPILPAEILKYQKKEWLIIYALRKFYIYEKSNPLLPDLLVPYISQSRYRKLLCYEPYQLLSYFNHHGIYELELFSFRIFSDIFNPDGSWSLTPPELLQTIYPFENPDQVSDMMSCMRNYLKAYRILMSKCNGVSDTLYNQYTKRMKLSYFLGYSFDLSKICQKSKSLFQSEDHNGYIFCFNGTEDTLFPYISIQFTIHWNSTDPFDIISLLENMIFLKIPYKYDCYLLSYRTEELQIALPEKHYSFICETIYHISYEIAKKENKLPLTIDENKR